MQVAEGDLLIYNSVVKELGLLVERRRNEDGSLTITARIDHPIKLQPVSSSCVPEDTTYAKEIVPWHGGSNWRLSPVRTIRRQRHYSAWTGRSY